MKDLAEETHLPKRFFVGWLVLPLQAYEVSLKLLGGLHEIPRVPLNVNCPTAKKNRVTISNLALVYTTTKQANVNFLMTTP